MAILRETDCIEKNQNTDENRMLEIVKAGKGLADLNKEEVSLPMLYQLSETRKNILCWYPFKENASILEIGTDCGAITSVLCEKAESVTVVENSTIRGSINYERNKQYENLEIIVGKIDKIVFSRKYDYIVLDDFMAYSQDYCEMEFSQKALLEFLAEKINDDGMILMATENRLGAKYFTGAAEEETNLYFRGINGFGGTRDGKTLSKSELVDACARIGFICNKFYYPFPNHKLPFEIFTDSTINSYIYGENKLQFDENRLNIIDENKLNKTLAGEAVADVFANSFLVELTKKPINHSSNISYVKCNTDCKKQFQSYTIWWNENDKKYVSKYALNNQFGIVNKYTVVDGLTLDKQFKKYVDEKDWESCIKIFRDVYQVLLTDAELTEDMYSEEFCEVFGKIRIKETLPCKKNLNINLSLDNILIEEGQYVIVDKEWDVPFMVPVQYVIWQLINRTFQKYVIARTAINTSQVMSEFDISPQKEDVFRKWQVAYQNEFVGENSLKDYAIPMIEANLNNQKNSVITIKTGILESRLYIDCGNGYLEQTMMKSVTKLQGENFKITYQLHTEESPKHLRWDPMEAPCSCMVYKVTTNKDDLEAISLNKLGTNSTGDMFATSDPCYELKGNLEGVTEVTIEGKVTIYGVEEYIELIEKINESDAQLRDYLNCIRSRKLWLLFKGADYAKRKMRWVKRKLQGLKRRVKALMVKEREAKNSNIIQLLGNLLCEKPNYHTSDEMIDVIVPIYNGYDYLVKLFPTLIKTNMKCNIFLVDDKSPDARVHEIEKAFAAEHENVTILENPENYGFVKSVNNALQHAKNHVALVNTDTELPEFWLERLMEPILYGDKIASSTPYSNSATIFSFPDFCYNNEIYRNLTVDEIDSVFQLVKPKYEEAPTGVGFCMGMNKEVIQKIGTLDYETFSKGFGEENDWCQRAVKAGYKNVQVENLFVYHKHGGSFTSKEKEELLKHNVAIVSKRYPNYDNDVRHFIMRDPNKEIREVAQMLLDMKDPEHRSVLAFDHSLGGGATAYLNGKVKPLIENGDVVTIVRYRLDQNDFEFIYNSNKFNHTYQFKTLDELLTISKYLHYDEIYINELVTYPFLAHTMDLITQLSEEHNAKLVMLFHDYFAICPSINLVGQDNKYCGFPDDSMCEQCFKQKQCDTIYQYPNVKEWQKLWKGFLSKCQEVRCFSEDTFSRVVNVYGNELALTLVPHKVEYMFPLNKQYKINDTINIGLLGILSIHKGSNIVKEMLEELKRRNLPDVNIILIGEAEDQSLKNYPNFKQTGRYRAEDVPQLVLENDIDMFLVPAVWPETFSYTTDEIRKMEIPVASFAIGAPASRIKAYDKGIIIPEMSGIAALDTILNYLKENALHQREECKDKKAVYVVEYTSFSSRYRIEHMKEELLTQGVDGEIWTTDALPKNIEWSKISKAVIYRCRYIGEVPELVNQFKAHNIPIFYDIDDLIFDYNRIANLPFLQTPEYKDFHVYSENICNCMKQSDAFLTSTDTLRECISEMFPEKRVYVNRNMASTQMMILSNKARLAKSKNRNWLKMGYFSGSNTHNGDFEIISKTLLSIMKEYPKVHLMIVGCLELGEEFNPVMDRIERVDFVDWRMLPELIASIDINLMPLEDSIFHAAKSENKWMEAALVEVPTIASYNHEMANHTSDKVDIMLCKTKEEWNDNMKYLIENKEDRERIAHQAWIRCQKEKSTLNHNEELFDFMFNE